MRNNKIPKNLQGVLWSKNISSLDLQKDKDYIIHQILAYAGLNQLKWLFRNYKASEIRKTFIKRPAKDYTDKTFHFIKRILLEIPDKEIDERYYVKTYPRIIG